ncbi:hypothetical protein Taro_043096 [Colocasia esculenta]|uniref:Retrotransposon gag domain-containing protein n=1 Tax=Colocasia esculenta TaxID=4460 RepID=A0A843WR81_COLES|nr:hypothetical protein [Colocasia esculenta]
MASRGRRGGVPTRDGEQRRDEPRREEQTEQQAPAPQGHVLPPPPPVDYGVFMQGLVQAMQMQAHTQAALQAQMEVQERADVWWASLLRTRFEDGAIDVAWDEFVRLFQAKFIPEHIQDRMEQEFLSLTQGSKTNTAFYHAVVLGSSIPGSQNFSIMGFKQQLGAIRYLGVPLRPGRTRVADYKFLIDKTNLKMNNWKSKFLSQAGRATLINSVINSIPIYIAAATSIPKTMGDGQTDPTRWLNRDPKEAGQRHLYRGWLFGFQTH